jgi:NADH:ubiquinone oxidoreductase subunit 6 (subunit J)
MDSLHAIGFYVSAALAGLGGILLAFLHGHARRGAALALTGLGLAGIYTSLSAGFAAIAVLVCYAAAALVLARPDHRTVEQVTGGLWRQVGALGAAVLLGVLTYAAFRGTFAHATFYGGAFGSVSVARLLFAHDALATEAVGGLVLIALVGAAAAWRRERPREDREGRR